MNLTPIPKKLNDWKRQKGVTFLEILAVLVILVLIYLAYARSFGAGTDKAKISDVQNSFKQYQIGFENAMDEASGLPSSNSINIDYTTLNKYLNQDLQISSPTNGTGSTHPSANPIQTSNKKDPWGNSYKVQAKYISDKESILLVRSAGKDKQNMVTDDLFYDTQTGTDLDDVLFATVFQNGTVKSCTRGLSKELGKINISGGATGSSSTTLSPVNYDVPLATRQPYESSYAFEYAVDGKVDSYTARSYIFSNTPLTLSISVTNGTYYKVVEQNNTLYSGLYTWVSRLSFSSGKWDAFIVDPPQSFSNSTLYDIKSDYGTGSSILSITTLKGQSDSNTLLGCS